MNDDLTKLKKGDVVVRFGIVHQITKVENFENPEGVKDKLVYFEPFYKTRRNETLKLSIPLGNLDRTTIRLPVTKTALNEEFKFLRQEEYEKTQFNQLKVKRTISDNNLHDISEILKTLWEEKRDEDKNFTISKRNTFHMVMNRFKQETACILGIDLEEAEKKIESALDSGWKKTIKVNLKKKTSKK